MLKSFLSRFDGGFLHDLVLAYTHHDIANRSAALSLYGLMSIFPFIAILVWVTTLAGDPKEVHLLMGRFSVFLPPDFAELLHNEVEFRISVPMRNSILMLAFHSSLLLFSAGSSLRSLLFSFRQIAGADDRIGVVGIVIRSVLFMIPIFFSVFVSSVIIGAISYLIITFSSSLKMTWLISPLLWLSATLLLIGFLNGLYASSLIGHQVVPIHGWLGSAGAAVLIIISTIVLTMYFRLNVENREWYGSPGFIVNVLLWFYACANCFLIGALINATHAKRKRRRMASAVGRRVRPAADT